MQRTCRRCGEDITGTIVKTVAVSGTEQHFHRLCFRCPVCQTVLRDGMYREWQGELYCRLDYLSMQQAADQQPQPEQQADAAASAEEQADDDEYGIKWHNDRSRLLRIKLHASEVLARERRASLQPTPSDAESLAPELRRRASVGDALPNGRRLSFREPTSASASDSASAPDSGPDSASASASDSANASFRVPLHLVAEPKPAGEGDAERESLLAELESLRKALAQAQGERDAARLHAVQLGEALQRLLHARGADRAAATRLAEQVDALLAERGCV